MPDLNDLGTAIEGGFDELVALATVRAEIDRERADEAARSEAADAAAAVKAVKVRRRSGRPRAVKQKAGGEENLLRKKPAAKKPAVKASQPKRLLQPQQAGRANAPAPAAKLIRAMRPSLSRWRRRAGEHIDPAPEPRQPRERPIPS